MKEGEFVERSKKLYKYLSLENGYTGMTVNERLYASGLLSKFDRAANDKKNCQPNIHFTIE